MALLPPMSTASLKFPEVGTTHTGKLLEIGEPQQETEYRADGQGPPAFWDDERTRPKMQIRVLIETAPDPAVAGDDGRRALYATVRSTPGSMYAVLNKAFETASALGGQLTVTYTGDDPESKNPKNPRKLYAATYVEPTLGAQMSQAAAPAAAPAPAAATPPPAAPVETIPAPWTAEQWATFTPEQKQAILAQQPAASQ